MKASKNYEVIQTIGVLTRDSTSFGYQFSIGQLEVERLVESYNFGPHENRRVKVIILIPSEAHDSPAEPAEKEGGER